MHEISAKKGSLYEFELEGQERLWLLWNLLWCEIDEYMIHPWKKLQHLDAETRLLIEDNSSSAEQFLDHPATSHSLPACYLQNENQVVWWRKTMRWRTFLEIHHPSGLQHECSVPWVGPCFQCPVGFGNYGSFRESNKRMQRKWKKLASRLKQNGSITYLVAECILWKFVHPFKDGGPGPHRVVVGCEKSFIFLLIYCLQYCFNTASEVFGNETANMRVRCRMVQISVKMIWIDHRLFFIPANNIFFFQNFFEIHFTPQTYFEKANPFRLCWKNPAPTFFWKSRTFLIFCQHPFKRLKPWCFFRPRLDEKDDSQTEHLKAFGLSILTTDGRMPLEQVLTARKSRFRSQFKKKEFILSLWSNSMVEKQTMFYYKQRKCEHVFDIQSYWMGHASPRIEC